MRVQSNTRQGKSSQKEIFHELSWHLHEMKSQILGGLFALCFKFLVCSHPWGEYNLQWTDDRKPHMHWPVNPLKNMSSVLCERPRSFFPIEPS